MSDGGEPPSKENEHNVGTRVLPDNDHNQARNGSDDYARALVRVAVAQVCEGVGYEIVQESALAAWSDVAVRFMCDIGRSASCQASLAARTECNVFDVVRALEDLSSIVGFLGAAETGQCPVESGVMNEIVHFVKTTEEIPFAQPITQFPVIKNCRVIPSFSQMGETPDGKHVPKWLPAFPDLHTYVHSPVWNERRTDPWADRMEQARQRRKAEKSLLNLQQRLLSSSTAGTSGSADHATEIQECSANHELKDSLAALDHDPFLVPTMQAGENLNPFLAPPLPAGGKDVATIVSPVRLRGKEDDHKKHSSVLELFAPAIDAMKSGATESSVGSYRKVLPERRPIVHFSLKGSRKLFGGDLDPHLGDSSSRRNPFLSMTDNEKDDKRMRAEMILKQSMGNSQKST